MKICEKLAVKLADIRRIRLAYLLFCLPRNTCMRPKGENCKHCHSSIGDLVSWGEGGRGGEGATNYLKCGTQTEQEYKLIAYAILIY